MLVDRLEALVNGASRFPIGSKVIIDEREALDVLDLMRTTVPEEIKQARRLNQDREKILAQAQSEANRIVTQAQERAERIVSDDNITQQAEDRARQILDRARHEAEGVRHGADDYALDMLERLDAEVQRIQSSVRSAIGAMHAQGPAVVDDGLEDDR
jgi:cell division septum initiation protein DivIVA